MAEFRVKLKLLNRVFISVKSFSSWNNQVLDTLVSNKRGFKLDECILDLYETWFAVNENFASIEFD